MLYDLNMNDILETIKSRFDQHLYRHEGIKWDDVLTKINNPKTLASIKYMEETGGEVDVAFITPLNLLIICDFSKETPKGRRSLCYDETARLNRKKNAPISSAIEEANKNGILLMDLDIYNFLQNIEEFDLVTRVLEAKVVLYFVKKDMATSSIFIIARIHIIQSVALEDISF